MSDYYSSSGGSYRRSSTPTRTASSPPLQPSSTYLTRPIHDTNFTEMLNRTRNNINRITQKYSTADTAIEPYFEPSTSRRSVPSGVQKDFARQSSYPPPPPNSSVPASVPALPPPPSQNTENDPNQNKNLPKVSSFDFEELINRITRLEKENEKKTRLEARIVKLENENEHLRSSVENLNVENKENRKEISRLMNQLNSHTSTIEILQHDLDSRRSTISKMDSWVRQGETWRNDIENQLSEMNSQVKLVNRIIAENKENIQERVTRNDLETFRDRINMSTQQTVLASLSNWNEKIELTVRHLERQVAALRIGATVNNSYGDSGYTGLNLTDDDVKKALLTQQPSEILLKGVVSSEVRAMENDLEKKMELHLSASLRSLLHESQREVREDMRGYLRQLFLASDISGEAIRSPTRKSRENPKDQPEERDETVITLGKYHAARREKEREMQYIADKMDDLSSVIVSLQEASESREKSFAIELRALERRLEECVTVSAAYVTTMQTRYSELEKTVQEREEKMRSRHRDLEEEVMKGLRENNEISSTERVELNKRMVLVEKMVEGVMERVDMSQNIFEGLFSTSPEIKRFQSAAVKLEGLLVEFTSLRGDVRELSANFNQIQAIFAKKEEISEIRERLAHVEPLSRKIDDLSSTLRGVQDHQSSSRQDILSLNANVDSIKSAAAVLTDRVTRLENGTQVVSKEAKDYCDRIERQQDQKIQSVEQLYRKELQALQNEVNQNQTHLQTQLSQQSNSYQLFQTQSQNTIQSLQSSLQALQNTSQIQGDKFDYLQQTVKELKTTLPRLETNILSHQKEVNNLQYEYSKSHLERDNQIKSMKEMIITLKDLERRLQGLENMSLSHVSVHPTSSSQALTGSQQVDDSTILSRGKEKISSPSKSVLTPPFLSSSPPSIIKSKGLATPQRSTAMEDKVGKEASTPSKPETLATSLVLPSMTMTKGEEDEAVNSFIDDFSSSASSSPQKERKNEERGDVESSFDDNIPTLDQSQAISPSKADDNTAMRDFDVSSFDSTPQTSPIHTTSKKSSLLENPFQSTPPASPIRSQELSRQQSPTRVVRDAIKFDDSDESASSNFDTSINSIPPQSDIAKVSSVPDLDDVQDVVSGSSDAPGDDVHDNADSDSSFGDINILEDHTQEAQPIESIKELQLNTKVDEFEALSSVESSPTKPLPHSTLSTANLAAERTQNFLSTLDNSFDESSDFDSSPNKPKKSLVDHLSDSHDDDDVPENKRNDVQPPRVDDVVGGSDDSRSDDSIPMLGEDSEQHRDDSSLQDKDLSSSDDDSVSETKPERNEAPEKSSKMALSGSDSDSDSDSESKVQTNGIPGKIPKSNSSTFSKQLEDVVESYWEAKGQIDDQPSASPSPSTVPAPAPAPTVSPRQSPVLGTEQPTKRVIDHSDSALYQLSDSESESDWDADDVSQAKGEDKSEDEDEKPTVPNCAPASLPPRSQLHVGVSEGSRNPLAVSSDEDSPFAHSMTPSHISSSSPEDNSFVNDRNDDDDDDDDGDGSGNEDADSDSDSENEIPTLSTLSPNKPSSASVSSSGDQSTSSTSLLSIRERLKLRQEALQKEKKDEFSSPSSPVAASKTATTSQTSSSTVPAAKEEKKSKAESDGESDDSFSEDQINKFVQKEKNFFDFDDEDEDDDDGDESGGDEAKKTKTSIATLPTKSTSAPLNSSSTAAAPATKVSLKFATKNFHSSGDSDEDEDDSAIIPASKGPSSVMGGLKNISASNDEEEGMVMSFDENFDY